MSEREAEPAIVQRSLLALGEVVLDRFCELRDGRGSEELAGVQHVALSDIIYVIDHEVEATIIDWLEEYWPVSHPVDLVMEGVDEARVFPASADLGAPRGTLVIDPLDGTREIMWDRRSAWFLGAYAPKPSGEARLPDVTTAVMVELPPKRHRGGYLLSGSLGAGLEVRYRDFASGKVSTETLQPFPGESLDHGFSGLSNPIIEGKERVSRFAEKVFTAYNQSDARGMTIFEDQYLATGGQIFDLMSGRLRVFGDLRPSILDFSEGRSPMVCHAYDICTKLLAEELGCVIESPDGSPLDVPLDLTSAVTWIGYANTGIAERMRPIMQRLLPEL